MSTTPTSTADLFTSLVAARQATANANAESEFLAALPLRLGLWGSFIAYGVTQHKPWARWAGGLGLAWLGVEYFGARRQTTLAQQAAVAAPQGGAAT